MHANSAIAVRYFRLSPQLQPYFTVLYATTINCGPGELVVDYLHPEWAALRLTQGAPPLAVVGPGEMAPRWPFVANGPTSKAIKFGVTRSRIWGLGVQPAGWARFVEGPARELSDSIVNGSEHPAFAEFAALLPQVLDGGDDQDEVARRINDYLLAMTDREVPQEEAIIACQHAIRDPDMATVADLEARLGLSRRSLERLCRRYFGFSPKLLIRRQRFLRSLAQFMLAPDLNWSASLDSQYHDQAQFVRDFKAFMGMSPRQYARLPHPILEPIMQQRMADQGVVEPLDLPTIMRYRAQSMKD